MTVETYLQSTHVCGAEYVVKLRLLVVKWYQSIKLFIIAFCQHAEVINQIRVCYYITASYGQVGYHKPMVLMIIYHAKHILNRVCTADSFSLYKRENQ